MRIIDRDGQIAFRIIDILDRKDLTRRLDYMLSGKRGKAPEPVIDTLSKARLSCAKESSVVDSFSSRTQK